jgi:hypothetical protein
MYGAFLLKRKMATENFERVYFRNRCRVLSFPDHFQPGGFGEVRAGIASGNATEFADYLTLKS